MKLTYLYNSGFIIDAPACRLIIDSCEPVDDALFDIDKPVIAIATHAHGDHFHPFIAEAAKAKRCRLVLGSDIEGGFPATYLAPGESTDIDGVHIAAHGSTDQGISALIQTDDTTIFHAGDLNDWHWQAESDQQWIDDMRKQFESILDTLPHHIDLALFPVDPRMGDDYDRGAMRFIEKLQPRLFVPMHFRDDTWAAEQFAKRSFPNTQIICLTQRKQSLRLL